MPPKVFSRRTRSNVQRIGQSRSDLARSSKYAACEDVVRQKGNMAVVDVALFVFYRFTMPGNAHRLGC